MCAAGDGGVLVTTYAGVRIYRELLLAVKWDYVVLDEGHKIRNPDAEVTLTCKQVRTPTYTMPMVSHVHVGAMYIILYLFHTHVYIIIPV